MVRLALAAVLVILASHAQASSYCLPDRQGREAIPRKGFCPSGFHAEGDCCRAYRAQTKRALPRVEGKPCPVGTYASGSSYCVSFQ